MYRCGAAHARHAHPKESQGGVDRHKAELIGRHKAEMLGIGGVLFFFGGLCQLMCRGIRRSFSPDEQSDSDKFTRVH